MTLYVGSDAKDTDFTIKLVDVFPDGTAYNVDDNIQRARYRDGYDKPLVWFEKDKVYKLSFQPMQTSILFPAATVGSIVLPVMLFHQIQLMACAWIAKHYAAQEHAP